MAAFPEADVRLVEQQNFGHDGSHVGQPVIRRTRNLAAFMRGQPQAQVVFKDEPNAIVDTRTAYGYSDDVLMLTSWLKDY